MNNQELRLFKSRYVEKNSDKEIIGPIEDEILAKIEEIKKENCVIGEGKTAKVFICERDPWSCYKIITKPYYPRLRVDQEMKFMDDLMSLGVRIPKPLFCIIHENIEIIAMKRVSGNTVRDIIDMDLGLPPQFDLNVFLKELEDFLRIMHNNRIYHRDLHEGNVMIDEEGKPWIIDFGDATRSFSDEEAYTSQYLNPNTKKMETIRYTSDESNLIRIRSSLRNYILAKKG